MWYLILSGLLAVPLAEPPTAEEVVRARQVLQDILGERLNASLSGEQKAVARELIDLAAKTDSDPTGRWVCLEEARRLALLADDRATAMEVVQTLGDFFRYPQPAEPDECLRRARELWKQAGDKKDRKAWASRLAALAWYRQALAVGELAGLKRIEAENRIAQVVSEAGTTGPVASLPRLPRNWFRLTNRNSGLPITIREGSRLPGADAMQWNTPAEAMECHWRLEPIGEYYRVRNRNSGLYLSLTAESNDPTGICQALPGDSFSQQWKFEAVGDWWKLVNRYSGLVLAISTGSRSPGTGAIQYPYRGNEAFEQHWRIEELVRKP